MRWPPHVAAWISLLGLLFVGGCGGGSRDPLSRLKALRAEVKTRGDGQIVEISASGALIDDQFFDNVRQCGSTLEVLIILWGTRITDRGFEARKDCESLKVLIVYEGQLGNRAAEAIAQVESLEVVRLHGAQLDSQAAAKLLALPNLKNLQVPGSKVDGSLFAAGVAPSSLSVLNLEGTEMDDAGLPGVAQLRNLEQLSSSGSNVTLSGVMSLRGLSQLKSLGLAGLPFSGDTEAQEKIRETFPGVELFFGEGTAP